MDADEIAKVLSEHHLSSGGRNLGQYRTEWTCGCGATWVIDGHRAESCKSGMDAHLAAVLAPIVEQAQRDAAVKALTAARDKWQWGAWANAPRRGDRIEERLANAQYVTDWLRDRAALAVVETGGT